METRDVVVTGGTGYMGSRLIPRLLARGHRVRAVVRPSSAGKLPGVELILGDALDANSFAGSIPPADTLVHLVGVAHPSPLKAQAFRDIDLVSAYAAVDAARHAGVKHFVYVSVAQPAPMMKAFIAVRQEAEAAIATSGLNATVLRPWYVLDPGHRWPYLLTPVYKLLGWLPSTRESALRLGMVSLEQMLAALVYAVGHPAQGVRIIDVSDIRATRAAG